MDVPFELVGKVSSTSAVAETCHVEGGSARHNDYLRGCRYLENEIAMGSGDPREMDRFWVKGCAVVCSMSKRMKRTISRGKK
jgi:hypothetical protein